MSNFPTRFPKRSAWRAVDRILEVAELLDPGDPDDWYHDDRRLKNRGYYECRHYDLVAIARAALKLRDEIAVLR